MIKINKLKIKSQYQNHFPEHTQHNSISIINKLLIQITKYIELKPAVADLMENTHT